MFRPRHTPKQVEQRQNAHQRGYDRNWRRLRDQHLAQHPLCSICEARGRTTAATIVDHIVPVVVDPSKRLIPDNLRSCCVDCHAEITTRFKTEGINEPKPAKTLFTGFWVA